MKSQTNIEFLFNEAITIEVLPTKTIPARYSIRINGMYRKHHLKASNGALHTFSTPGEAISICRAFRPDIKPIIKA